MTNPSKFDLYSVFVQTITASENMRRQSTSIYASLTSAGIVLHGSEIELEEVFVYIPIIVVALIWFCTILYFRKLASAKFKVINLLEAEWEIKPFKVEYEANRSLFADKLTFIEMTIPILILIFYLCLLVKYWFFNF
jgi:hypothetical protein